MSHTVSATARDRMLVNWKNANLLDSDFLSISSPDGDNNDTISSFTDNILDLVFGSNRELDFPRLRLRRLLRSRACRTLLLNVGLRHGRVTDVTLRMSVGENNYVRCRMGANRLETPIQYRPREEFGV